MKRILTTFLAVIVIASTINATVLPAGSYKSEPGKTPITFEQFMKMTPREIEQMTGKKMNFVQKLAVKAALKKANKPAASGKSQLTAALLAFFLGWLGIHRFYLGYTWQGIVQLLTLGGFGIWALIDFIRILTGDLKPKDGEYEKKLGQ
jgi:TM2 domain-containing membrane protein YozV